MPELFLLAIACLLPGSPLIAGLRDQLLDWIESLGEAISGRTAWAARLVWTLTRGSLRVTDAVLALPQPSSDGQEQKSKLRQLWLMIGTLITTPVFIGLLLSHFDIDKLRLASWFGLQVSGPPLLPLETLAGILWGMIVVAWGMAAFDAVGLLPLAPYHWLAPALRRCLAALFFAMLLLSFIAAMLLFDLTMAVAERRQPLIPGASATFNLLFALLLHASVAVTGWTLPLSVWVATLVLVALGCVLSLILWALLVLLTRVVEDLTIFIARTLEVVARLGRLIWNALAQSPPGEWLGLSPLDEPSPWSWQRHVVGGPLQEDLEVIAGLLRIRRPVAAAAQPAT